MNSKRIVILGSTGSIGRQTLEVICEQEHLCACGLGAGTNARLLAEQARAHHPEWVALAEASAAEQLRAALPGDVDLLAGPDAMTELVRRTRPDILLSGMVGAAGLAPTLAGIACGATPAIANKETLVMAGAIIVPAARAAGLDILPVDSEHSAICQCLASGRREDVRCVTITASGGALRDWPADAADAASVDDALNHPTWNMGRKITIDSATLINKALELIEAHWLFDLSAEQLAVVIHPESIVHSLVEFCDGSVIAQLAEPDMTLPIAFALNHPHRPRRDLPALDLPALGQLTFREPTGRFARAVELGLDAIRRGELAGAVLNSANEAAVDAFVAGHIRFGQIVPLVEQAVRETPALPQGASPTLDTLTDADAWARRHVRQAIEAQRPNATPSK